jgi:hypothetical protein
MQKNGYKTASGKKNDYKLRQGNWSGGWIVAWFAIRVSGGIINRLFR